MKRYVVLGFLMALWQISFAQLIYLSPGGKVSQAEYFIDADPGRGNAKPLIFSPLTDVTIQSIIELKNVSPGLHRVYFRAKNELGKWGPVYSKPLIVTKESENGSIQKIDYSIDVQPTIENSLTLKITPSKDVSVAQNIGLDSITPGMHRIYFKAQDDAGNWSTVFSKPLIVNREFLKSNITRIEYFIDHQDSIAKGNYLNFNPSPDVTATNNLSLSNLSNGLHRIYFKAQDETGNWSAVQSKPLLIAKSLSHLSEISKVEYFIDHDPGLQSANPLAVVAGQDVSINANIPLKDITLGQHYLFFRAKDNFGLWSAPQYALFNIDKLTADFVFQRGWNIFSSYIKPDQPDLKSIFQPIIDVDKLTKVMDETGKAIENFGALGGWRNSIGNFSDTKGYKVHVKDSVTLTLDGTLVPLPLEVSLNTGWNLISYPCTHFQDAKVLVQDLIDSGKLIKIMSENGNTIENFGPFGGWKNNIGNFEPGHGYKVCVNTPVNLNITDSGTKGATIIPEVLPSLHFTKIFEGNGTEHMNVHLINLESSGLRAGDEIGVFDGKYCVGAATLGTDQLLEGTISIAASSYDGMSAMINGFTSGHPVDLQVFRGNKEYKLDKTIYNGTDAFEKNGSLFISVSSKNLPVDQNINVSEKIICYPNPFRDQVTIEIHLTEIQNLSLKIYDLSGKLIREYFKPNAGFQETYIWDGKNGNDVKMVPGTYVLKVNKMVEKIVLKK